MSVLLTGSIAYDYIMQFPGYFKEHILPEKINTLSVSFLVDSMKKQRGGVATNIAYNLALLGERPRIMATVGHDFDEYRAWLDVNNIDTSAIVVIPEEHTASFFASTDRDQNQIASFYTGAMAHARTLSFKKYANGAINLVVISPNDPGAMVQYARGVAFAATGRAAEAQAALDTLKQLAAGGVGGYSAVGWTVPSTNLEIATHALAAAGVYVYRERRSRPYREVRFNEKD